MSLPIGTRIGPYEITSRLGEGGMGIVFCARDTVLRRSVALKLLPDDFTGDPERLARFQREAQVLASLNHPNVAQIYGLEQSTGESCIVMELVEGETLQQRLARGPMMVEEALNVARQIAEALEAAHERGIIHRDLKPGNIMLGTNGRVKVLDFGLAKAHDGGSGHANQSNSPTLVSMAGTHAGVILGTAAYMSPEQARGLAVDKRTDIFAFGCVFYEMLTARQAFASGDTVSDTLANILKTEPDWQALPPTTPPRLRALLERCLRKNVRRRWTDMGQARIEIEETLEAPDTDAVSSDRPRRHAGYFVSIATLLLLTTSALAIRHLFEAPPVRRTVQFQVFPPHGTIFLPNTSTILLSPDGRKLAFALRAASKQVIWVHSLDKGSAEPIPSTDGVGSFFWSADSMYLAFVADGRLKKVAASGGPAMIVCNMPNAQPGNFGDWNAEGVILVSGSVSTSTWRVSANGGEPLPATVLDATRNETAHLFPSFLPDGRHFLYLATSRDQTAQAYIGTLDSKDRRLLPGISSQVKYSPSGHLIFIRDGSLMAQPFDVRRLDLSGDAFTIAEHFVTPGLQRGPFSVSAEGSMAYRVGETAGQRLTWFDRAGKQVGFAGDEGEYRAVKLSWDDRFVAFPRGVPADVYILDIARGLTSRLTSSSQSEFSAVWSPDGKTVLFDSLREGIHIYERGVDVLGEDKLLLKDATLADWSLDGRYITYTTFGGGRGGVDAWALPMFGERKPIRLAGSASSEREPRISPDSRWVAYQSSEAGNLDEIFLQSFPEGNLRKQVSVSGGIDARWSRDGKELFYIAPDFTLMAVTIRSKASGIEVDAPVPLFQLPNLGSQNPNWNYDTSKDGRFLVNVAIQDQIQPVTVILNWHRPLND